MSVSTEKIKELRETTGAGILDIQQALEASEGDMEKAAEALREKGLASAAKRADRETLAGILDLYTHGEGRVGVMVEVNCETDFVARTEEFRTFTHEIALQIAANDPHWVTVEEVPGEVIEEESASSRVAAKEEGKPDDIVEKIVAGRLEKFYADRVLLHQPFIRDDELTVEDYLKENIGTLGENIVIRRFERWTVGESLE